MPTFRQQPTSTLTTFSLLSGLVLAVMSRGGWLRSRHSPWWSQHAGRASCCAPARCRAAASRREGTMVSTGTWRHYPAYISSIYLVYIYTVFTRYLHCSTLLSGRVFSCCHGHTSGQHGHSGKLKSPQIVIVEAKSIFITITRGHGLLFYWVYLPTILCVRACLCYVTMCKM